MTRRTWILVSSLSERRPRQSAQCRRQETGSQRREKLRKILNIVVQGSCPTTLHHVTAFLPFQTRALWLGRGLFWRLSLYIWGLSLDRAICCSDPLSVQCNIVATHFT